MKRILTAIISLFFAFSSSGFAQSAISAADADTVKIRYRVRAYAASKKRVIVTAGLDHRTTKGYVDTFDDEKFTLSNPKSGHSQTFRYADVRKIQKSRAFSPLAIATLAAFGAGAAILIGAVGIRCRNEGGC